MFSFVSFPQVISTTGEEFSTMKNQNASFSEELVGFNRYFNSNLHLEILGQ